MIKNLKVLTLAVTAALVLFGTLASTASAWFTWEGNGDPPIATGSAAGFQVFYGKEEEVGCAAVSFDNATVFGGMITATPTFSNCTYTRGGISLQAHVEPTSCDIEFHTDWAMGIECPSNTEMHVSVTSIFGKLDCLTIPSQTHGGPENKTVTYTNEGSGASADIRVSAFVKGIEYTRQGICGAGTVKDGGFIGDITVKGDDPTTKKQIGVSWDDH